MHAVSRFLTQGGWAAWCVSALALGATGAAGFEGVRTAQAAQVRNAARDDGARDAAAITRMRAGLTALGDSVRVAQRSGLPSDGRPVIIVSLTDNRLWVRDAGVELFTTRVASGSGRTLIGQGRNQKFKFDTPRGMLTVKSKETALAWVPPDWHFVEQAGKRGLGILRMKRGQVIPVSDGVITTRGSEVVKRHRDGSVRALTASDGRELAAGGRIIIPPFGTNARRYKEILGTHRLNLGDGYALHGTNAPNTIGRSVSHGCVRLRNEDIETLYRMIPVGTAVYIY
ncbi:MAG: L,D-transpeptidase [Gemmatimonadaceae bacterium]|nr:L,D-transpeptidase [Gemmatimonadaceae bacterium]